MDIRSRLVKLTVTGITGMMIIVGVPQSIEAAPLTEGNHFERMDELDSKENEAEAKLKSIVEKIEETEQEATGLIENLQSTAEELVAIQEEIQLVSSQIDQRESQLKSQVRAVQVTGQSNSILSFLLESDSLGDALGRFDVVNTLFSANQNLMQKQIEDKEFIAENERLINVKHEEQTLLAARLENSKVELEENQAEQEMVMARIATERAEIGEEREALAAEQRESERRLEAIQTSRVSSQNANTVNVSEETETGTETEVSLSSSPDSSPSSDVPTGSVVNVAHGLSGSPYSFSGSTPAGFDCSGFTQFAFQRSGKSIARTAASQFGSSTRLSQSEARPGDLIFFSQSGSIDHVGIYLGGGRFIGSQSSTGVAVASFTSGYWSNYVAGFGRP